MKIPDMWDAALEERLKGLWIIGYDVAQTDPNLKKVREALSHLEFLVVQDLFVSQTAKFAHLLLPGASFLEKDGTFTNLERRIQRIRKVAEPPNGILPDWQVVCEVSTAWVSDALPPSIGNHGRDGDAQSDARRRVVRATE